ncbi:hypothetical protein [Thaumasiovibrio subtropicus]|nr:hypothetical protein [Thaumasiovibrio subtropicus]
MFIVAALASAAGFFIHVVAAESVHLWVAGQMEGRQVIPSWDVRQIAMITSIEYGIAITVIYMLIREKLYKLGKIGAAFVLSAILLSLQGALIRQPLMDWAIGNPFYVSLVQNGFKWLVWLVMALVIVLGVEYFSSKQIDNGQP